VNMSMALTIIHIAVVALVAQHEVEGKEFSIRTDSDAGMCHFSGYVPGGKVVIVSPTKSETARAETNILANIAGFGGNADTDVLQFPKIPSTIETIVPKLGPSLALFSVVFGVIDQSFTSSQLLTATPKLIEDLAYKAVNKLIRDVMDRITDMKNYMDLETMNIIKDRVNVEFIHMFTLYSGCLKEVSLQRAIECQEDANQYIRSGFSMFMLFTDELKKFTESSPPTVDQIKKMELTFLPFREYATLSLMQLQNLKDTYRDNQDSLTNGPTIYRELLGKLSSDAQNRINYAQNMFKWIDLAYDKSTKRCEDTKTSSSRCTNEGSWGGNTVCTASTKCQFDKMIPFKKYCAARCTVRVDGQKIYKAVNFPGKNYGNEEAGKVFTAEKLDEKADEYLNRQSAAVKNYYQAEIFTSIPVWQEIKNRADAELSVLNDETIRNYNFERRQFKRTHAFNPIKRKYMPVSDFEFLDENDEKNSDLENRKLNYRYQENYRRSEYPILRDAEYGEFNDRFEKKLKDGRYSPRFKERYQRAFDTMRYFDDLNRARRF